MGQLCAGVRDMCMEGRGSTPKESTHAGAGLSDTWRGRRPEAEGQTRCSGLRDVRQSERPKGSENAFAGLSAMWRGRTLEGASPKLRSAGRCRGSNGARCRSYCADAGYPRHGGPRVDCVGMSDACRPRVPRIQGLQHDSPGMSCTRRVEDPELASGQGHLHDCTRISGTKPCHGSSLVIAAVVVNDLQVMAVDVNMAIWLTSAGWSWRKTATITSSPQRRERQIGTC